MAWEDAVIEGLELITKRPSDSSFPSGHSNASFAVACAVTWCLDKGKKWILQTPTEKDASDGRA